MPRDFDKVLNAAFSAVKLKCPKCGKGKLYKSAITLKTNSNCPVCGFDIKNSDTGDGPAYVALCTSGVIIPIIAVLVEALYSPSYIVHALLWLPLLVVGSWLALLYSRAVFISVEYKIRELETNHESKTNS
jgi:uncharacterized protein (DUF983 family)